MNKDVVDEPQMKKTLLEKAKETNNKLPTIKVTDELIELAIAWLKGDITNAQATQALEMRGGSFTYKIAIALREAYRKGILKL